MYLFVRIICSVKKMIDPSIDGLKFEGKMCPQRAQLFHTCAVTCDHVHIHITESLYIKKLWCYKC